MTTNQSVQSVLQQAMQKTQQEIAKVGREVMWETLKELEPLCEKKVREIINNKFYYVTPPSEYYDRTKQFLNSVECKATQGGGNYVMELRFNPDNVFAIGISEEGEKHGDFLPYAYTWGVNKGEEIPNGMKEWIFSGLVEQYGIEESFVNWFERMFDNKFQANFRVRIREFNIDY